MTNRCPADASGFHKAVRVMLSRAESPDRTGWLQSAARVLAATLGLKVLASIVLQYGDYFPANFEAPFLTGRQESFTPLYAAAFYVHIVSGPPAILLAAFLMWSRGAGRLRAWHRWAGRAQAVLIFAALMPSALVMAPQAFAGPVAGLGFAALAVATASCAGLAIWHAANRRIAAHRLWASRCFVLLISPLILRLVSGGLIVTGWESPLAYCLNAWLSWLAPLAAYEGWRLRPGRQSSLNDELHAQPAGLASEAIP